MNLRNKVSFLLFSFVAVPLFAQTPQQELERLQQNYIQSFISNDDRTASLVELLSGIQPETEISDQVVVELHQRYPFNVEKITGYMETIREDGSWPDINYNDQKRSGWSVKEHADRVLELAKLYRLKRVIVIGDRSSNRSFTWHWATGFGRNRSVRTGGITRSVFPRHWDQLSS